ncbi:MAG: CPBP family intramembrane glutamic endopeptidase, partial [Verrucomicrobiota bacterium]
LIRGYRRMLLRLWPILAAVPLYGILMAAFAQVGMFIATGITLFVAYCYLGIKIKRARQEPPDSVWGWHTVTWENLRPMLIRFAVMAVGMTLVAYGIDAIEYHEEPRLFFLLRVAPEFVLVLFLVYPLFSALPQEFIFCTFFFERYQRFFPTDKLMILASAVVFAYAHVLFINLVAPVLSFIAGLIFASTYAKTKSLALVTIEHGLYGNYLFIVGLGWFFYGGAVQ